MRLERQLEFDLDFSVADHLWEEFGKEGNVCYRLNCKIEIVMDPTLKHLLSNLLHYQARVSTRPKQKFNKTGVTT